MNKKINTRRKDIKFEPISSVEVRGSYWDILILGSVLVIACWLRLRNLGALALMGDEGIQALVVEAIHIHGVPKLESGVIYSRALLFQYLQAAVAYLFDTTAFWLRLPSVFWGCATLIPAYILGKTVYNRSVGLLVAIVLAFSMWEIELSRYARFYTMFQFFFVVALICFYRGFMRGERSYRVWFLAVSAFALSAHQGGKLLGVLFLIPFLSPAIPRIRKLIYGGWAVAFGIVLLSYRKFVGFLHRWEGDIQPVASGESSLGGLEQAASLLNVPSLKLPNLAPFVSIAVQHSLLIGLFALLAGGATAFLGYRFAKGDDLSRTVIGGLSIWAAFFHQFGVVLILVAVYIGAFAGSRRILRDPIFKMVGAAGLGHMAGWMGTMVGFLDLPFRDAVDNMLGFPNVLGYFLKWFVPGWPVMTGLLVLGSVLLYIRFVQNRRDVRFFFLLGALYFSMILSSLFVFQAESRYAFHLYPLIVLISVLPLYHAGELVVRWLNVNDWRIRRITFGMGALILLLVSQDANPIYAWEVGNRTYQSEKDPYRSVISWSHYARYHPDRKGPSQYVREHMREDDTVIALGTAHMVALYQHYIGRVDYVVAPNAQSGTRAANPSHYSRIRGGDTIHYINGSNTLSSISELKNIVQARKSKGRIWILGDYPIIRGSGAIYSPRIRKYITSACTRRVHLSRNGTTFVVII